MASASVGIQINEPSPMSPPSMARPFEAGEGKGKNKVVDSDFEFAGGAPVTDSLCPPLPKVVQTNQRLTSPLASPAVLLPIAEASSPSIPVSSPTSVLCANDVLAALGHPGDGEADMDQDGDEDYFLELGDLVDYVVSTESSKKRKLKEGDECSSRGPP